MDAIDRFEKLVAEGADAQARKAFSESIEVQKTGAFRFEIKDQENTPTGRTETLFVAPELEATPGAKGVLFRNFAALDNKWRNTVYFDAFVNKGGTKVITQGDSWFAFPLVEPVDVAEWLAKQMPVFAMGCPGDDVTDMASGQKMADLVAALKETNAEIVALSGGGNELIGDDFPTVLRTPDHALSAVDFIEPEQLSEKIAKVIDGFEEIIQRLISVDPKVQICAHSYDYPVPRQQKATFLGPVLSDLEIPDKYWIGICAHIIDQFDDALVHLAKRYAKNFFRVDLRGIAGDRSANWADEIHLNSATAALAANEFIVQFKKRLGSALKLHDP